MTDTYVHPYYNKKIAVSQSIISKKSSVAIIIVAIIRILRTFSRFVNVLYSGKCCYCVVLAERDKNEAR
ncbi:MAG: hypothetical protein ACJ70R_08125 [Nitrososphaera sp.]